MIADGRSSAGVHVRLTFGDELLPPLLQPRVRLLPPGHPALEQRDGHL